MKVVGYGGWKILCGIVWLHVYIYIYNDRKRCGIYGIFISNNIDVYIYIYVYLIM